MNLTTSQQDRGIANIRGAIDRADWRNHEATGPQHNKIRVLLDKLKNHNGEVWMVAHAWYDDHKGSFTKGNASDMISALQRHLDAPARVVERRTDPVAAPASQVWAEWRRVASQLADMGGQHGARFAVDTEPGAANGTAFWWVVRYQRTPQDMPKYFLRQVIGGQGPVRVRMSPEAMIAVARKIMVDPKASMLRYGREIGECGHCGRTLTNDESRAAGIGPVCRKGKGW